MKKNTQKNRECLGRTPKKLRRRHSTASKNLKRKTTQKRKTKRRKQKGGNLNPLLALAGATALSGAAAYYFKNKSKRNNTVEDYFFHILGKEPSLDIDSAIHRFEGSKPMGPPASKYVYIKPFERAKSRLQKTTQET